MRLARGQNGVAMVMVLAFLALSVPVITGALSLASTLSLDSRVKTTLAKSQYCAMGGVEDANHRLLNEAGYAEGLVAGSPDVYSITCNGQQVPINVLRESNPTGPPPSAEASDLQTSKGVTPTTAAADTLTTYTYTITVENQGSQPQPLYQIHDGLPPEFSYLSGTTSGITTSNPTINIQQSGSGEETRDQLTWDLTSLALVLDPLESAVLTFDAQASVPEGNYCNQAWAEPKGPNARTGPTAKIVVASPPTALCQGEMAKITKTVDPEIATANTSTTFTYTVTIENVGTTDLELSWILDLLPPGFTYVFGSSSQNMGLFGPIPFLWGGRQRLLWFSFFGHSIPTGQTRTLTFDATASVASGDYYNEIWAGFDGFSYYAYTWPTAEIKVMDGFRVWSSYGGTTASSQVWLGDDVEETTRWGIDR